MGPSRNPTTPQFQFRLPNWPRTHKHAFLQERGLDAANAHDDDAMSQTFDEVFQRDVVFRTPLPTRASGVEAMKRSS